MKLITSIKASTWATGFRHVHCSRPECNRWLTERHLSVRPVGVRFLDAWYCSYRCVAAAVNARLLELLTLVHRPTQRSLRTPLGLMLVSRGFITEQQLHIASERHRAHGGEMGEVLLELGFATEAQVTAGRSAVWNCPVFTPASRVLPSDITIPASLMEMHSAVPMNNRLTPGRLLVGFLHRVDYGLLYATEQMTGCKATPCFLTPTDHRAQTEAQSLASEELVIDEHMTEEEITSFVCRHGARLDANELAVVRCGSYLWMRVTGGKQRSDLLFRVA